MSLVDDTPPTAQVINITDHLKRVYKPKTCHHRHFEVDKENHVVTCTDCDQPVDAFEALLEIANYTSGFQETINRLREEKKALDAYQPFLKAVKELERVWRRNMVPQCPHCNEGILAEELARRGCFGKDYYLMRQRNKKQPDPNYHTLPTTK